MLNRDSTFSKPPIVFETIKLSNRERTLKLGDVNTLVLWLTSFFKATTDTVSTRGLLFFENLS